MPLDIPVLSDTVGRGPLTPGISEFLAVREAVSVRIEVTNLLPVEGAVHYVVPYVL